ncbi:hypothetical protein IAI10_15830 [Clostridium sp. 19966]|uniref:cell division protein FtsA n=1 Tax=Clostridium sp. 19966 TaxID=2768166 RepID=UPI0028DF33F1|nr:cell division FtsA domain-containing protein [Clostridium sp. 19966]MDT8718136.1 hypothetical protein [Clostridium sp. 19966]
MSKRLVAFDINSSRICAVAARVDSQNRLQITSVTSVKYNGMKKSVVVDVEKTAKAVKECKDKLENIEGHAIEEVYLSVPSGLCEEINFSQSIKIESNKGIISEKDNKKVLMPSDGSYVSEDRVKIFETPVQYIVDGVGGIINPLGMKAKNLQADTQLFTMDINIASDLARSVEDAGLIIISIIPQTLALVSLLNNEFHKTISGAFINIAADTIDLSMYKEGKLCYTKLIPLGESCITSDLSTCLEVSFAEAERIKFEYENYENKEVLLSNASEKDKENIDWDLVEEIIHARLQELISFCFKELSKNNYYQSVDSVYITGSGISRYKDYIVATFGKNGKQVKNVQHNVVGASSPMYINAVGVVKYVFDCYYASYIDNAEHSLKNTTKDDGIIDKFKKIIHDIF